MYKLEGRSKGSKTCLFVSDIHDGNINALSTLHPIKTIMNQEFELKINEDMKEVHYLWCDMVDNLSKKKIDFFCINGEPYEGENRKGRGDELWSSDVNDQINDIEKLVKMIDFDKYGVLKGSRYHVKVGNSYADDILIERLSHRGKNIFTDSNNKPIQNFFANIEINGKLFSVTHHVRMSSVQSYRGTPLGAEAAGLEFMRGRLYPHKRNIDVIMRGHIHFFWYHDSGNQIAILTPSWKLWDEFTIRKGLSGALNHVGGVELVIEPNGKIEVVKHLLKNYPIPKIIKI